MLGNEEQEAPSLADFTPLVAVLWMLGAFVAMVSFAFVLMSAFPDSRSDLVALGLVSAAAFVFVAALLVGRYPAGPRLSRAIGLRPVHPLAWPFALLIGILSQAPAEAIQRALDQRWPLSTSQLAARSEILRTESAVEVWALVLVVALLVPLAEEVFFRGAVYGALRRGRVTEFQAALVTGLGFAFCHFNARLLLPLAFVALMLGLLRSLSGSLWPALVGHVAFNAVPVLTNGLGVDLDVSLPGMWQLLSLVALALLLLGFVLVVGRDRVSLMSRREEVTDGDGYADEVRRV